MLGYDDFGGEYEEFDMGKEIMSVLVGTFVLSRHINDLPSQHSIASFFSLWFFVSTYLPKIVFT